MGKLTDLSKVIPQSETQWRGVAAEAHRTMGYPGAEAAAKTHEHIAQEIRDCKAEGSTREPRLCPRCEARGVRVHLIFMGGEDRCGNCYWPGVRE